MFSKLQYISQGKTSNEQLENIHQALDAGCTWIQLRFKNAEKKDLHELAEKVKQLCLAHKAIFIINDDVELAKLIDADGVHLGLQDTSPVIARNILGNTKIIGGTANTVNDVEMRINEKCDYIGLGPYKFTTTKENLSPVLGIDGYTKIITELKSKNLSIPIYAIGGITLNDVAAIMETGIFGIAVSGLITNSTNKKELIEQLNKKLYVVA